MYLVDLVRLAGVSSLITREGLENENQNAMKKG